VPQVCELSFAYQHPLKQLPPDQFVVSAFSVHPSVTLRALTQLFFFHRFLINSEFLGVKPLISRKNGGPHLYGLPWSLLEELRNVNVRQYTRFNATVRDLTTFGIELQSR
jgi:hypothetical protein